MDESTVHPDDRPPTRAGGMRIRQSGVWSSSMNVHLASIGTGAAGEADGTAPEPAGSVAADGASPARTSSPSHTTAASSCANSPSRGGDSGAGAGGASTLRLPSAACLPSIGLPGEDAAAAFVPLVLEPYDVHQGLPYSPPGAPLTPDSPCEELLPHEKPVGSPPSQPAGAASVGRALIGRAPHPPSSPAAGRGASGRRSFAKHVSLPPAQHAASGLGPGAGRHHPAESPTSPSCCDGPTAAASPSPSASPACSPSAADAAARASFLTSLPPDQAAAYAAAAADEQGGSGGGASAALLNSGRRSARRLLPPLWHASQSAAAHSLGAAAAGGSDDGDSGGSGDGGGGAGCSEGGYHGSAGHGLGPEGASERGASDRRSLPTSKMCCEPGSLPPSCSPRGLLAPLPSRPDLAAPPAALALIQASPGALPGGSGGAAAASTSAAAPSSPFTSEHSAAVTSSKRGQPNLCLSPDHKCDLQTLDPATLLSPPPHPMLSALGPGPGHATHDVGRRSVGLASPPGSSGSTHGSPESSGDEQPEEAAAERTSARGGGIRDRLLQRAGPLGAAAVCGSAAVRQEMEDAVRMRGRSFVLPGSRSMPSSSSMAVAAASSATLSYVASADGVAPAAAAARYCSGAHRVLAALEGGIVDGTGTAHGVAMARSVSVARDASACPLALAAAQLPPIAGRAGGAGAPRC